MTTSIGYFSGMSGVTRNPNSFVSPNGQPSNLGGGYNGYSPALLGGGVGTHGSGGMEGGNERSMDRLLLRQAWNGQYASGVVNGRKPVTTPFRRVNNAGDYLGRQNYVSGGSDQVQLCYRCVEDVCGARAGHQRRHGHSLVHVQREIRVRRLRLHHL